MDECKAKLVYTIPLHCQICLDQVKMPVVCSNHHLFCGRCLKTWLKSHQECPTCRVPMTESAGQPIRGVAYDGESDYDQETRFDLLHTRSRLLMKDYEKELNSMSREMESMKSEMHALKSGLASRVADMEGTLSDLVPAESCPAAEPQAKRPLGHCPHCGRNSDEGLSQKDFSSMERAVEDMKKTKERVEHENSLLTSEVRRVRLDLQGYSPRKASRYAAAAEESRTGALQREVNQLKRALERSDRCIDELRQQAATHSDQLMGRREVDLPNASVSCTPPVIPSHLPRSMPTAENESLPHTSPISTSPLRQSAHVIPDVHGQGTGSLAGSRSSTTVTSSRQGTAASLCSKATPVRLDFSSLQPSEYNSSDEGETVAKPLSPSAVVPVPTHKDKCNCANTLSSVSKVLLCSTSSSDSMACSSVAVSCVSTVPSSVPCVQETHLCTTNTVSAGREAGLPRISQPVTHAAVDVTEQLCHRPGEHRSEQTAEFKSTDLHVRTGSSQSEALTLVKIPDMLHTGQPSVRYTTGSVREEDVSSATVNLLPC